MRNMFGRREPGGLAFPWMTPAIYGKLQQEVDAACDEMIRSHVRHPSPETLGQMSSRVYDNLKKAYPEVEKYARAFGRNAPGIAGGPALRADVSAQWGGAFLALIAVLLLAGFYWRRGYYGRR